MAGAEKDQDVFTESVRGDLAGRVRTRLPEIEAAIVARLRGLVRRGGGPEGVAGLRKAVSAWLGYAIDGIESPNRPTAAVPPAMVTEARWAARKGLGVNVVLRCCAIGSRVLEDFIVAEAVELPNLTLRQILGEQGALVDRLMELVSIEYRDERVGRLRRSPAQRRVDRVTRLLESDTALPPNYLGYGFDLWHVGLIFVGPKAEDAARSIESVESRSMVVHLDPQTTWVWLGGPIQLRSADLARDLEEAISGEASVALGEPRRGLAGWRQTHREAKMALQATCWEPGKVTRSRDVILVAAVLGDQLLATTLIETFLTPLNGKGDWGEVLRSTLRAYFEAGQNTASTAATLGVARHTVERRLRSVEERLGETVDACHAQLQVALEAERALGRADRGASGPFCNKERQVDGAHWHTR